MELADVITRSRSRLALLLVLPIGAALLAAAVTASGTEQHRASLIVDLPDDATPGVSLQDAADLRALLGTDLVADAVAEETGLSAVAVEDGLAGRQLGTSTLVEVSFTHDDADVVVSAVEAAAETAVALMSDGVMTDASAVVAAAEGEVERLETQLASIIDEAGTALPRDAYEELSAELDRLSATRATLLGPSDAAAFVDEAIRGTREERARLAPLVAEFDTISQALVTARRDVVEATQVAAVLDAAAGRAGSGVGSVDGPEVVGKQTAVLRAAVSAGVVAGVLVLGALLLTEVLRRTAPATANGSTAEQSRRESGIGGEVAAGS